MSGWQLEREAHHPVSRACIYGIRISYGKDGDVHGFTERIEGIQEADWVLPDGEGITRVEGEINGHYVSRLQFFTDGGSDSRAFGALRGTPFTVSDPAKGTLRTIGGWANLRKHPSLKRAPTSMTFPLGAPYFIESIDYDTAALEAARRDTAPERCARVEQLLGEPAIAGRWARRKASRHRRRPRGSPRPSREPGRSSCHGMVVTQPIAGDLVPADWGRSRRAPPTQAPRKVPSGNEWSI